MHDPPECSACRSEGVPLAEYRRGWERGRPEEKKLLCLLCAGTRVGQIDDYRHLRENSDLVEIQRQINYVGNTILKAIEEQGVTRKWLKNFARKISIRLSSWKR
jgi:hypothetical protein